MPNPWLILAVVAALGAVGLLGYQKGVKDCTARHNAALLAQIEAGEKLEQARRVIAQERDKLLRELEGAAYADPVTVERCLSADRVRRLNAIR